MLIHLIQYMPSKPDKFGIKFWIADDVKPKYMLHSFSYMGKDDSPLGEETLGEQVVLRLTEPYRKTVRKATTDNFFTSVNLAKTLKQRGISIVGTVNRIRRDSTRNQKNERGSLHKKVFKHDGCTLTVYQAKTTKTFYCLLQCTLLLIQVTTKNLSLKT